MKIVSITEQAPQPATLPDGVYSGVWGGYVIVVSYKGKTYELKTAEGVKGIGIKVVVTIDGDDMTFVQSNN